MSSVRSSSSSDLNYIGKLVKYLVANRHEPTSDNTNGINMHDGHDDDDDEDDDDDDDDDGGGGGDGVVTTML
ncbi:hypothetical protein ElyMa_004333900 [Elysia marginata]|uniref:Uncharacterized protein n=1 Tax=Elysia marginata TaxID=1093978 RepID=A0AAV4H4D7_9GAST|nr:hypothetical protein ElyMa_004333900 [Elysia marginata]